MNIFEFQLRLQAYEGLSRVCKLERTQEQLINMVIISPQGVPDKAIQQISPDELKELTKQTYSNYKKEKISTTDTFSPEFSQEEFHKPLCDYIERLEYELKVIKEMGFNTYMLVVSDFVSRARDNSIMVGPGRGSGAGSLLAYLTGITDINPFLYNLLFERFLNPARVSLPDFDIDFEDTLREKVVQYVTEKYGYNNVCAIGTYMKLATKAAFKDAARAIGIPFEKSNQISNLLGEVKKLQLIKDQDKSISTELLSLYQQDEYIQKSINQGAILEGNLRQLGVHACGVIISPDPVTHHVPTQTINKGKQQALVSQFDGPTLEYIGLVKMDFLGLRNLSVIKNCVKIIQTRYHNPNTKSLSSDQYESDRALFQKFLDTMLFHPDLDDEKVFETVFAKGDTTGIFQFEGEGIRKFLIDLKPNHINDLVAMNALYRPGPLEFIPTYIKRKHGEEPVEYMLPELANILEKNYKSQELIQEERSKLIEDLGPIMDITYGIAVYQEQLMFLVQSMAGFSLPEADLLRRGVGKKKKAVIEKLKKEFIVRAASFRNYKKETAIFIYEKMIEPAASYSFNKSHAVCYAYIAYQTAYLKAHYPVEFYASLLRSAEEDTDRLASFIQEVKDHNITVSKPCVNTSFNHIAAIGDTILLGFFACKGIGYEVGKSIQAERKENGLFSSLEDFLTRCNDIINKKSLESLIKSGSLDERYDRNTLLKNISTLLERNKVSETMSMGLFGGFAEAQSLSLQEVGTGVIARCKYEMDIFKAMISGHPLDGLYPYCKKFGFISQYKYSEENQSFSMVAMILKFSRAKKKGFFVMVEDSTDEFEFFVKDRLDLKVYDILIISGYKTRSRNIDTMIKLPIEKFIEQAKKVKKFDPQRTVERVRRERNKDKKKKEKKIRKPKIEKKEDTTNLSEKQIFQEEKRNTTIVESTNKEILDNTTNKETIKTKDTEQKSKTTETKPEKTIQTIIQESKEFKFPESIQEIKSLIQIITNNPGQEEIKIGNKKYMISESGYQQIYQKLSNSL